MYKLKLKYGSAKRIIQMIQELSTGRIIRIILSCTYILAIRYFSLFTRYFLVMLYSQKKNYPRIIRIILQAGELSG